ncbi:MAG: STAS domain-containing protein [Chitinivibrionales bacterium]
MPKAFATQIEQRDGVVWIILPETIDMDNYRHIEEMIEPELTRRGIQVVFDFSKTTALFSSGLGLIIRIKKQIDELKGKLFLLCVSRKLEEGFSNVGLDKVFTICRSREELQQCLAKS